MIVKKDNKWLVMDSSGKKILGTHYSKEEAKDQLAAIEISKKKQKEVKESPNFLNNSMTNLTEYYKNLCNQLKEEILILEKKIKEEKSKKSKKSDQADKDYDGDGKVESKKDEYFGSKDKAIKKAIAKREGKDIKENVSAIYNPKNDSAGLHPLLWSKETWAKDAAKARARLDSKKSKDNKVAQKSALDITTQSQANSLYSPVDVNNQIGTVNLDHAKKFADQMKKKADAEKLRQSFDSGASRSIDSIMTRIGDKSPDVFSDTRRTGGSYVKMGTEAMEKIDKPEFEDISFTRGFENTMDRLSKNNTGKAPMTMDELLQDPSNMENLASHIVNQLRGGSRGGKKRGVFEDREVTKAMNALSGNAGFILPDIRDNGAIKNNNLVEATAKRLGKTKKMINEDASGIGLASLVGHPKAQEIINSTLPAHIEKIIMPLLNPQLEKLIQRHQDNPKLQMEISSDLGNLDAHHSDLTKAMSVMEKQGLTTHPLYYSMDAVRMALNDAIGAHSQRKDRYGQSLLGRSSLDRGV